MRLRHTVACIAFAFPVLTFAAPAHVHGVANVDLAVDGNKLTISMEMPLDNTVGFEHLPSNDKQRAALADSMVVLKNAAELFSFTPAAECTVESAEAGDPFPGGKAKPDGHADVDADYAFHCAKPEALNSMSTTLFKHFSRLHRINLKRATASGQGAATMSAEQPSTTW